MKNALFKTMLCASISATLLAGCANDDVYDPNAITKKYKENWEKQFGDIDPQQTWNTSAAQTANISIGYSGKYTLKIYTANPRSQATQAYLLGQFEVEGGKSHSLQFDMPSSLTNIYVSLVDQDGGQIIKTVPVADGKVSVAFGNNTAATRTIYTSDGTIHVSQGYGIVYGKEDCQAPLEILPEGENNQKKVTENFLYKSIGKLFYIRPIYFKSNSWVTLGIYYYDENNNIQEKNVWTRANNSSNGCWWRNEQNDLNKLDRTAEDTDKLLEWGATALWCQSIKIEIPYGLSFGFYIQNGDRKFYSEKKLNETYDGKKQCHAATFDHNGERYLAFEDWANDYGSSDMDLNDLVCVIGEDMDNSGKPEIVEKDETEDQDMKYLIACEDLGGSDDFDFNDVVLAINHVSGTKTASVELLAAGGTLPAKVMYDNTTIFEEVHEAFGVGTGTLVNTGGTSCPTVKSNAIEVPDNFSITTHASKFKIIVTKGGHSSVKISVPDKNGSTPQAFVIADPNWEWPKERQNITEKYPKFSDWVSNHTQDDWYNARWD